MSCYYLSNMALFVRQNDDRSELQKRVAAELQDKLNKSGKELDYDKPESDIEMQSHLSSDPAAVIAAIIMVILAVILGGLLFAR